MKTLHGAFYGVCKRDAANCVAQRRLYFALHVKSAFNEFSHTRRCLAPHFHFSSIYMHKHVGRYMLINEVVSRQSNRLKIVNRWEISSIRKFFFWTLQGLDLAYVNFLESSASARGTSFMLIHLVDRKRWVEIPTSLGQLYAKPQFRKQPMQSCSLCLCPAPIVSIIAKRANMFVYSSISCEP